MLYFDNNATTRPLDEVVEAMLPFLRDAYANPSSIHQFGQSARHRLELAREQTARLIGAAPREIIFTASGTESINTAIRSALAARPTCRRILTTAVEHSATLRVCEHLAEHGYTVDYVDVDHAGRLNEEEWSKRLTDDVALATLLQANNETGALFDVPRLAALAADRGIPVHVDAVQSAGKLPIAVADWPVNYLSLSAHKFHGPKGAGALYVRKRSRATPLILGGSQERNLRGGTENVPAIIGLGAAAQAALRDMSDTAARIARLRDDFETRLLAAVPFASVNAAGAPRIHNTANISFAGLQAEAILIVLSEAGICASSGAACSSGSLEPSHVLKAMHVDERSAHGAIRFSLSRYTTPAEIDEAVHTIPPLLTRLTALTPR